MRLRDRAKDPNFVIVDPGRRGLDSVLPFQKSLSFSDPPFRFQEFILIGEGYSLR
jgi:hypothetical protein